MTRMLTATYGESVSSIPFLDNGPPIGPILNGTKYMVRPFIHPGNLSSTASCNSFGLIQWPRVPKQPNESITGRVYGYVFSTTSLIIFLPIFAFANFFFILEAFDWLILNRSTFQITFDSFGYFRDRFTHFRGRNYSFGLHSSNILRISPCQKTVLVLRQWCQDSFLDQLGLQG